MNAYLYGILMIGAGGIAALMAAEQQKTRWLSVLTGLGMLFLLVSALQVLFGHETLTATLQFPPPIGAVSLVIDRLSAFFICVIAVMSFIGTLYAVGYLKPYTQQGVPLASHLFFLSALIISMLLVVVVHHALAFLIVWEIMSLSSFFLVVFEHEKDEVSQAGLNYMVAMHIGVALLISGFALLSIQSGSYDFQSFSAVFAAQPQQKTVIFLLFFLGFGMKAGVVPLHSWLPKAHPAAPSHISGMMSGIMIKTGIYGILRILLCLDAPTTEIAYLILAVSILSGIVGIASGIAQRNIKRMLAYSSVENIGIIGIGVGVGILGVVAHRPLQALLGFSGSLLHVLNHSLFKSLLFFSVGVVYQQTHLLNIEKLGGLFKPMKTTAFCFLIGAVAISGLPPLNGFVGEFFLYWGMLNGLSSASISGAIVLILVIAGLALIGAMALLCFANAFSVIFLGSPRSQHHAPPQPADPTMRAALCLLCVAIVLIGLFPQYAFQLVNPLTAEFLGPATPLPDVTAVLDTLRAMSGALFLFLGISIALGFLRFYALRDQRVSAYKTWDCGYQAGNVRMQYTASSFAAPFVTLLDPLLHVTETLRSPEGLFPPQAHVERHVADALDVKIINPFIQGLRQFLSIFSWIQSGNTQQYILYGLLFLIAITVWMMTVTP